MLGSRSGFLDFFGNDSHTLFNTLFIPDSNFSNSLDTFFNKFRINFTHILFELFQNELIVLVVNDSGQDLNLFILDVIRVGEFGEETLNIVLEYRWTFLNDVLDIFEDDILHLLWSE